MKKYLFILFVFSFNFLIAQGNNLQFNRALYENFTVTLSQVSGSSFGIMEGNASSIINVPANKVWKITYVNTTTQNNASGGYGNCVAYISKSGLNLFNDFYNTVDDNILWLPSGSYDLKVTNQSNEPTSSTLLIGIEFNIVQ